MQRQEQQGQHWKPGALTQALPAKLRRAEASNTCWMQGNSDELDLASRVRAEAYAESSDPDAREQEAIRSKSGCHCEA